VYLLSDLGTTATPAPRYPVAVELVEPNPAKSSALIRYRRYQSGTWYRYARDVPAWYSVPSWYQRYAVPSGTSGTSGTKRYDSWYSLRVPSDQHGNDAGHHECEGVPCRRDVQEANGDCSERRDDHTPHALNRSAEHVRFGNDLDPCRVVVDHDRCAAEVGRCLDDRPALSVCPPFELPLLHAALPSRSLGHPSM